MSESKPASDAAESLVINFVDIQNDYIRISKNLEIVVANFTEICVSNSNLIDEIYKLDANVPLIMNKHGKE